MSFSDFVLAILVLAAAACIIWIMDINPYSSKLQVYSQTCDNMILENTYCKGDWLDNPIKTFSLIQDTNQITATLGKHSQPIIYDSCTIQDRKNWSCTVKNTQENITVNNGLITLADNNSDRQITRLKWLQNKLLNTIN